MLINDFQNNAVFIASMPRNETARSLPTQKPVCIQYIQQIL